MLVPPRTRRDSKRDALVRAAREEFAAHGFLGTHLALVAARVGIRKSTFFHYYPDKESLYQDAVGALLDDLADAVDVVADGAACLPRIDMIVECLHRRLAVDPALPRLVLRCLVDAPLEHATRPTAMERVGARIVEALQSGLVDAPLPLGDPTHLAPALLALVCLDDVARFPLALPLGEPLIGVTPDMRLALLKDRARRLLAVR